MKRISQVKFGIALSYILIVLNTFYTLAITPFIISCIGIDEYGVYKTMSSLSASMMVIDLGIGGTVQRYVAKYKADEQEEKLPNFIAMHYVQAVFLASVLSIVCMAVFFLIEPAYKETFSFEQLKSAKITFGILSISMVVHVFGDVANGIIVGCNHFIFGNGIKIFKLLLRVIVVIVFLLKYNNAVTLAVIDLILAILVVVLQLFYISGYLNIKVKYEYWDKRVFFESGKYTILMFITTLVTQINSNVDNIIVGAFSGPSYVAIYSIGLLFFAMLQNISGAVSGVMLPTVTYILKEEDYEHRLFNVIVKAGRLQFMLLGAIIVGFICIGRDFVYVWLGPGYEDVYPITLLLIIPSIFELCINVCLSVLRAKNMLGFRTITSLICTALNVIITVIAVRFWSYIGAAVGTAFSYIACSLFAMNLYYSRKLHLPMIKIYKGIARGILPCILIAGCCLFVSSRFILGNYAAVLINVLVFCIVYAFALLSGGLTSEEKKQIPLIRKYFQ